MAISSVDSELRCRSCSAELPRGAIVCSQCHSLVFAERLAQLSAEAKHAEASGELLAAKEKWIASLALLPPESKQAEWIRSQIDSLDIEINAGQSDRNKWAKRLGPLAPIAIILAKGKGLLALFKLKFLFSFVSFIGVYWAMYGMWFGVGFAVSILIHELGHYIDIKRRGLPVEAPVFIPGFGAYVKWQALGVSEKVKAQVSLAGPLAGWCAAAFCAGMWLKTGDGLWAALARTGAWLNVLNLIPVWQLDGAGAVAALNKIHRSALLVVSLLLWFGLHEGIFCLVAAGMTYRLFTKDDVQESGMSLAFYYALLLMVLGLLMHAVPHQSRGLLSP